MRKLLPLEANICQRYSSSSPLLNPNSSKTSHQFLTCSPDQCLVGQTFGADSLLTWPVSCPRHLWLLAALGANNEPPTLNRRPCPDTNRDEKVVIKRRKARKQGSNNKPLPPGQARVKRTSDGLPRKGCRPRGGENKEELMLAFRTVASVLFEA